MELILQVIEKEPVLNITDINGKILNAFNKKGSSFVKINGNTVTVDSSFFKDTKVPDCIRQINNPFEKMEKKNEWNKSSTPIDEYIVNTGNNIVLILESPHKDEYTKNFDPLCPANGNSGRSINTYLPSILLKETNENIQEIIICNPIQCQTSLHVLHGISLSNKNNKEFKQLRNEVWRKLWCDVDIKNNFIIRLEQYKPRIIINACTQGLKEEVESVLSEKFSTVKRFSIIHPASWARKIAYAILK